ncbi:MAG: prolyl oligopeptidase family serine peptidase [Flavobacteriales bacterium]|nr:prolyl oligopeptidase family serine peptidase [Flavobacteriales bacterium]
MIAKIENHVIDGLRSKPIVIDVVFKQDGKPKQVVIFSHGFKGFKDWGHFNKTAELFAEQGFVFVKFNFSHGGHTVASPEECTDVEAFGNNNFTIEMDDLGCVIDWVTSVEELKGEIDKKNINLVGHSRGGGITILKAAEDTRIKKLVTWAAVCDFGDRYTDEQVAHWKQEGKLDVVNGRTGQVLPLYYQLYENYHTNIERLSIPDAANKIDVPFLIIHGTADEAVAFEDAINLNNWCATSQLIEVDSSGHTFEGKHPFEEKEGYSENLEIIINETIKFLQN